MNKQQITRNFSRYADLYDDYAQVQRHSAQDLAKEFDIAPPHSILEIGSGTGLYTHYLQKRFPDAKIFGADISEPMVALARRKYPDDNIFFLVADAEKLPIANRFDLVTSAACFQWLENPEQTLTTCFDRLETHGQLVFSIFGPRTFCELDEVLRSFDSAARVEAIRFPTRGDLHNLLSQRFSSIQIVERFYHQTFPDIKSLLMTIKYCGVRGKGSVFGPERIRRLDKKYRELFGEIRATSQVFLCKGQKT